MSPETTDRTTKAATDAWRESPEDGCRECGWVFGPDLSVEWVLGRAMVLCANPWACWERQMHLSVEPPQGLGFVQVDASK